MGNMRRVISNPGGEGKVATRSAPSVSGLRRSRWTRLKREMAARLNWLWNPLLYTGVLLGFLLGRALPSAQIAPFGIAFFVAVRAAGFGRLGSLGVAFSVILGSATVIAGPQLIAIALAIMGSHFLATLMRLGIRHPTPMAAAVVAALVVSIPAVMADKSDIVTVLFWCGLTGVLAQIFTLAVNDATSGRIFLAGAVESPVPVIMLLALAFSGLQGLPAWGSVSLHNAAASALIMLCAFLVGPAMGTVVAAVFAVSFLFSAVAASGPLASPPESHGMAYVIAGLLAGTFRDLRKLGVAVGFFLGLITYAAVLDRNPADLYMLASSALVGTAVFWLLPIRWLSLLPSLLESQVESRQNQPLADSPADAMAGQLRGVARVLREVGRTFEQVAAVSAPPEPTQSRIAEQVVERVCHSCSMFRQCWGSDFNKTHQLYSDLWAHLDEVGPLPTQPAPENLEQHCIYSPQVAFTLNYLHDLHRSREQWERRIAEGRELAGDYVRNVARMLERLAEDATHAGGRPRRETEPVVRVVSGVARLSKRGSHVSGDSYVVSQLSPTRHLLALSDGMGVGKGAATESKRCVALLEEILGTGLGTEVAVNTVNSVLLLRSTEDAFATVDLALLETGTGRAEFVKIGASPSFVKRGNEVTVVKMASVPAGIINQVQVEPEFRQMCPGDILVMITDGIWDVSKDEIDKERWLIAHLARERSTDPEEIAEGVLARALELMPEASDDMTVLAARIDSISVKADDSARIKPALTWVAARSAPRPRK